MGARFIAESASFFAAQRYVIFLCSANFLNTFSPSPFAVYNKFTKFAAVKPFPFCRELAAASLTIYY